MPHDAPSSGSSRPNIVILDPFIDRLRLKRDGTRAEIRFGLSPETDESI